MVKTDGVWEGYENDIGTGFKVIEEDAEELQSYYEGIAAEVTLSIQLIGAYDKFTYNAESGTYTCEETLIATNAYETTFYCFNIVVTFDNGKVVSIASEYHFDKEESRKYYFIYTDIGTAKVEIPQYVKDEANKAD